MKRDSSSNDGPPSKFQRPTVDLTNVAIRFLIPGRAAGIMIGKGGENIKKIRSQFNVKLNIPDSRGPERIMTIEGDLQAICNVMKDVSPKLKDIMNATLSDPKRIMGNSYPRRRGRFPDDDEPERDGDDSMLDYRILVHESQAGSVIGRGGERIKELREKNHMRVIKVYQVMAPNSTDRVVQMVAEPENAVQCLKSVIEAVESAPPRGRREDYDAANFSEFDALNYGGWLSREAVQAISQGMALGPPRPPMGYMGGGQYNMMGGDMGYPGGGPMGRGSMGRGPRGPMGMPPGPRGVPPGGPAPVPPPGGSRGMGPAAGGNSSYGGGGYNQMGYDNIPPYDNGAYGNMDPMAPPNSFGGSAFGGSSGGSGYGGGGYGGSQRGPVEPASMGSRGGGYGMSGGGMHDDAKVNQWYGGWS